jgi:hypothetical protein
MTHDIGIAKLALRPQFHFVDIRACPCFHYTFLIHDSSLYHTWRKLTSQKTHNFIVRKFSGINRLFCRSINGSFLFFYVRQVIEDGYSWCCLLWVHLTHKTLKLGISHSQNYVGISINFPIFKKNRFCNYCQFLYLFT